MNYEYKKLRGRIIERFESYRKFAKAIHVSAVAVSNKLNGKTQFSQRDVELWAGTLEICKYDYGEYFYT